MPYILPPCVIRALPLTRCCTCPCSPAPKCVGLRGNLRYAEKKVPSRCDMCRVPHDIMRLAKLRYFQRTTCSRVRCALAAFSPLCISRLPCAGCVFSARLLRVHSVVTACVRCVYFALTAWLLCVHCLHSAGLRGFTYRLLGVCRGSVLCVLRIYCVLAASLPCVFCVGILYSRRGFCEFAVRFLRALGAFTAFSQCVTSLMA